MTWRVVNEWGCRPNEGIVVLENVEWMEDWRATLTVTPLSNFAEKVELVEDKGRGVLMLSFRRGSKRYTIDLYKPGIMAYYDVYLGEFGTWRHPFLIDFEGVSGISAREEKPVQVARLRFTYAHKSGFSYTEEYVVYYLPSVSRNFTWLHLGDESGAVYYEVMDGVVKRIKPLRGDEVHARLKVEARRARKKELDVECRLVLERGKVEIEVLKTFRDEQCRELLKVV